MQRRAGLAGHGRDWMGDRIRMSGILPRMGLERLGMLWRECRVVRRAGVERKNRRVQSLVVNSGGAFRGGGGEQLPGWSESVNRNAYQVHSARLPEKIRIRYWCNQGIKIISPVHGMPPFSFTQDF